MPEGIEVKSILNKTKRRDPWFLEDYTINPYSGCSFNCLYCYIRGSKYGEHMEEKVSVKTNAMELLDKQLGSRAKRGQYGIIVLSSATDAYLQFEKELRLTRQLLEIILKHRFPVHIITKSDLVVRDFDLLKQINEQAILPKDLENKLNDKVIITFSFSTLDNEIAKIFEPGATLPSKRLKTLELALGNGFLCGVSLMPLLPFITDNAVQLELMFDTFSKTGAKYILPATITLFGNGPADSKTLMLRAVEKHYPQLLEKYHNFLQMEQKCPPIIIRHSTRRWRSYVGNMKLKTGLFKCTVSSIFDYQRAMTDSEIIKKCLEELESKRYGPTEQFLNVLNLEYDDEGKPIIARIDRDKDDGTVRVYFPVENQRFYFVMYVHDDSPTEVTCSTESYNRVYFRATSETLDFDQLSSFTILKPTGGWSKGDSRKVGKGVYNFSSIEFTPNPEPDEFEDKLDNLLKFLAQDEAGVKKLVEIANGYIQVAMNFHVGNSMLGGPHLSNATIKRMNTLNLEIDFDLYIEGKEI